MGYNNDRCSCFVDYVTPVCRLWGIMTAIGMWGVGAEVTLHRNALGVYVLVAACLLTFLEITWAINIFLGLCIKDENHPFLRCWDVVLWLDLWKKTVMYLAIAAVMFVNPHRLLPIISGTMLVVLALLYLLATYKVRIEAKESLLNGREDTYDRFDDVQDDIDDSLPEPVTPERLLTDQDEILEV